MDGESDGSTSDSQEFSEVEDEVFLQSLKENLAEELEMLAVPTPYQEVVQKLTMKDWKKAESNCGIKLSLWSTTHRATQPMERMLSLSVV
jgi:hypothetical protein